MNSRLVPLIALVVVATDAVLLATGTIGPTVALALFLIVEIPLGALAITGYVRRYRAHRALTETRREALRALAADDPYLRLAAAEARTVASLARSVTRRPDVPAGAVPIGYARGTLGMPTALAVAAAIELVAVHLLVPWSVVRLVLDLLGIYGLLMVLGWLAGRIVRPHLLDSGVLTLRSGPHVCARIPLDAVADVRRERRHSPTNAEITGDDDCGGALVLPGPDGTNLCLTLSQPVAASVPDFGWRVPALREVSVVRLQVDDPEAAMRAVRSEARAPTAS
ncbi:hypothetical protein [Dietzia cinnamea]|uniref:hypothetical protein n=1 Tax=Dietzia cinnamea TaxID=321318 RepID=UPI0021A7992D|nr:hypothetical protein [Dietzia cinnamea]MCT2122405.1 hypothetical protein [Dietzia cinnamea]MCT2146520.1 hypothetical protein [Dietzia cinnamea]MCT2303507.1 hypothetical protein [Dietzia cinnamea]